MITGLGGNATALDAIVFEVPADNAIYPQ